MQPKVVLKPDDQLQLSETELKEELTRILSANNPNAPHNVVRWNFKEHAFKLIPSVEMSVVHFEMDTNTVRCVECVRECVRVRQKHIVRCRE